jgi:hypothetical protein
VIFVGRVVERGVQEWLVLCLENGMKPQLEVEYVEGLPQLPPEPPPTFHPNLLVLLV